MIRVRDDDVLIPSAQWPDAFGRFKQIHEWIQATDGKVIHVPSILVNDIKQFPECIRYIAQETKVGRMEPEVHGIDHEDYAARTPELVKEHLLECIGFIQKEFNWNPTKWYTPHGAGDDDRGAFLNDVAKQVGLTRIGVKKIQKLKGSNGAVAKARRDEFDEIAKKEIFMHWWEAGARLARVCQAVKYNSWEQAAKKSPRLFK